MQINNNHPTEEFFIFFLRMLGLGFGLAGFVSIVTDTNFFLGILFVMICASLVVLATQIPHFIVSCYKNFRKRKNFLPPHMNNPFFWLWFGIPTIFLILVTIMYIEDIFGLNILGGTTYIGDHIYTGSFNDKITLTGTYIFELFFLSLFFIAGYFSARQIKKDYSKYYQYLEDNKVSLGLFTRPYSSKSNIVLANKYVILEYDISSFVDGSGEINITDKVKSSLCNIKQTGENNIDTAYEVFSKLCENFDYQTTAEDIHHKIFKNFRIFSVLNSFQSVKIYLDINQASEAELTAIPGISIAKAKHAIKVRKEQKLFLSAKQFFNAIGLEQEFIQEIPTNGNKVLLNELPMYKISSYKNN